MVTDYEALGGKEAIEGHVRACVQRFADDFIIGYLFQGRDLTKIIAHEVEHASGHLGGPTTYTGRALHHVHRPLKINAGHFRRRLAIVRTVLTARGVPEPIVDRWVQSEARFKAAIVDGTDCAPPQA